VRILLNRCLLITAGVAVVEEAAVVVVSGTAVAIVIETAAPIVAEGGGVEAGVEGIRDKENGTRDKEGRVVGVEADALLQARPRPV
jgi:hypothetical protein